MMAQLQEKQTQIDFPTPFLPNDVILATVIGAGGVHFPKILTEARLWQYDGSIQSQSLGLGCPNKLDHLFSKSN